VKPHNGNRGYCYLTDNELWFISCSIRQLPGGLFRDGEVWKSKKVSTFGILDHKYVETGTRFDWKRVAAWGFALESQEEMHFTMGKAKLPRYVIAICRRLSDMVGLKFPHRGIGVGVPSDGGMKPIGRVYTHENAWERSSEDA
jgi:hypothetical protein